MAKFKTAQILLRDKKKKRKLRIRTNVMVYDNDTYIFEWNHLTTQQFQEVIKVFGFDDYWKTEQILEKFV